MMTMMMTAAAEAEGCMRDWLLSHNSFELYSDGSGARGERDKQLCHISLEIFHIMTLLLLLLLLLYFYPRYQ